MTREQLIAEMKRIEQRLELINVDCTGRDRLKDELRRIKQQIAKTGSQSA
ncbi:hypothetical protein [Paenibacillus spongiae]|uniref:Uncharacterized protein n=1 Tax=Paenibacillus spongiae TaxID=2909671 RepID=A0ABY5SFC0_9BACL|nr:hypothetical protein [Paenibacillus spongiae]UVI31200.1 hypothetical protein L1F29_04980 [Paenibacillus spongiae]